MPYVNIKITKEGNVTKEQKAALIKGATDLLVNVLHKNPASTVVVIDEVDLDNWGLGGDPILVAKEKNKKKLKSKKRAAGMSSHSCGFCVGEKTIKPSDARGTFLDF